MLRLSLLLIILHIAVPGDAQHVQHFSEQPLFQNGTEGYACFRIPAIIRAGNGDLLAFAEGRRSGCADFGDVDIVMRRSRDNGQSWSPLKIVAENGYLQAGNPAPLLDSRDPRFPTGRLFLLYNTGNNDEYQNRLGNGVREVWYRTSTDHGQTWSTPTNITLQVHRPRKPDFNPAYNFPEDWRSYALTPGHAFQLQGGPHAGRLLVPANHSAGPPQPGFNEYRSHVLYSDDHGQTWSVSANVDIPSANEATGAELSDGRVMLNIRQQNGERRQRLIAISEDGGQNWARIYFDSTLIGPVCEASILPAITPGGYEVLLFSNPASTDQRRNGTVRLSADDGRTWSIARTLRTGAFAYSDLVAQTDNFIGCLYEQGNNGSIHYARFNFAWLLGDPPPGTESLIEQLLGK